MTDSPSTAARKIKAPQDHKPPESAVQAEAEGVVMSDVVWRGITLTLPTDIMDWDGEAVMAFQDGKIPAGIRAQLTAEQFAAVMASTPRPKYRDLVGLGNEIGSALGFISAGE